MKKRCKHGIVKVMCKRCTFSKRMCRCGRRLTRCTTCKIGGSICPCGLNRYICKLCSPHHFCLHKVRNDLCTICTPLDILLVRSGFCSLCGVTRTRRKSGQCFSCDQRTAERTEHKVFRLIKECVPPVSSEDNVVTGHSCGERRRRADLSWVGRDRIVYVEIDEESHMSRPVECEVSKVDSTKWGVAEDQQCLHTVFIRFNPDKQRGSSENLRARCEVLANTINYWTSVEICTRKEIPTVVYLYYGDAGQKHIIASEKAGFKVEVYDDSGNEREYKSC